LQGNPEIGVMKDLKAGGDRIELPEAGGVTDESLRNFF
jgi:syntaxin 1B/2/3